MADDYTTTHDNVVYNLLSEIEIQIMYLSSPICTYI